MKRTLLGAILLVSVVGMGSVGVYYAHPLLTASLSPPAEADEPAPAPSDDTLTPIPLSAASQESTGPQEAASGAANPFARSSQPVDSGPPTDRYGAVVSPDNDQAPAEIPDAREISPAGDEMPSTRSEEPLELNDRSPARRPRFAEQPTSAEEIAPAEADEPSMTEPPADAPRPLAPREPEGDVDRYGRSSATRRSPLRRQEPLAEQPAAEQPVEEAATSTADEPATEPADVATSDPPAASAEGTGRPGDPQLSGAQAPTLAIEKTAPPEIQIGKPAKFTIKVRNTGTVTAHGVEVHDSVPQGTQLIDTAPAAKRGEQGELVWDLGTLKPGDEHSAEVQLMPMSEGEIGSVATVHFRAEASVRTMATKPLLNMEVFAPSKAMKGEEVVFKIKLSNPGSGAATGVVLSELVPEGLKHTAGNELEFEVGTLKPGESRELELGLVADAAGLVTNVITAHAEANLETEVRTDLEVVAPQLQVSLSGPKRRYLERNATHNISVSNPGTAVAKDIELAAALPRELKFVEANNGGQYDAATHSVYWSLEELPPQETGTVVLTTLPQQPGEARLTIKSTAQDGLKDERQEVLSIEGLAAINFQLSDINDPIESGGDTAYEVRVTNQGSKAATGVRVVAIVPAEMKALSAEGPVRYKIDGQRVVFEPLKQLAPKADTSFTIKVKALSPGDLRLQVQISTDDIREPITKEEGTRVYGDE